MDAALGLNPDNGPFGGIAKISSILKEQRSKAGRVLHVDLEIPSKERLSSTNLMAKQR